MDTPPSRLGRVLVTVGLALAAAWLAIELGLRWILRRAPKPVVDVTRRVMSRAVNPVVLRLGARFRLDQPVLYHIGRRSGREYATPVCASPTPDGFIVPLAFGPDVDWLRNVRATGTARLAVAGSVHRVLAEEIDAAEALRSAGGAPACSCWRTFRVERFLRLRPEAGVHAGVTGRAV